MAKLITKKQLDEVYIQSTIKEGASEGFFNVFIFRKISIYISWMFATLEISPNIITLISFLFIMASSALFILGNYFNWLIALILFALAYIIDMCDGEVARLNNKKSSLGAFLDPFLDRVGTIIFISAISYSFYILSGKIYILYFLIFFISLNYFSIYIDNEAKNLKVADTRETLRNSSGFLKNSYLKKYLKWDGGFTIVLYSLFIIFKLIPVLIICLCCYIAIINIISFKNIITSLK